MKSLKSWCRTVSAFGVSASFLMPSGACAQIVTINITAQTTAGVPMPSVPFFAVSEQESVKSWNTTDVNGIAIITLDVTPVSKHILVYPEAGVDLSLPRDVRNQQRVELVTLQESYAFRMYNVITLQSGVATYNIAVEFSPAIRVTGQWQDGAGNPIDGDILNSISPREFLSSTVNGAFDIPGVPQSRASRLFFETNDGLTFIHDLTAAQTAANVNLGVVQTPLPQTQGRVSVQMTNITPLQLIEAESPASGMTFVAVDGGLVVRTLRDQNGFARRNMNEAGETTLPPGTYYIVPGPLSEFLSPTHLVVVEIAVQGINPPVPGLPIITVTADPNQVATLTFDGLAAYNAALQNAIALGFAPN